MEFVFKLDLVVEINMSDEFRKQEHVIVINMEDIILFLNNSLD